MFRRGTTIILALIGTVAVSRGDKKAHDSTAHSGENDIVELTATAILDPETVKQMLGSDLGGHYILMDVKLAPKEGRKVAVHIDDFLLRTDKDGERTGPFEPDQIAGRGAIVVTTVGGSRGGFGVGPMSIGTADIKQAQTSVKSGANEKPDPVLDVLKQKILPEKETETPVSGLLYFPMEKQKLKNLELIYTTAAGKLRIRFK